MSAIDWGKKLKISNCSNSTLPAFISAQSRVRRWMPKLMGSGVLATLTQMIFFQKFEMQIPDESNENAHSQLGLMIRPTFCFTQKQRNANAAYRLAVSCWPSVTHTHTEIIHANARWYSHFSYKNSFSICNLFTFILSTSGAVCCARPNVWFNSSRSFVIGQLQIECTIYSKRLIDPAKPFHAIGWLHRECGQTRYAHIKVNWMLNESVEND